MSEELGYFNVPLKVESDSYGTTTAYDSANSQFVETAKFIPVDPEAISKILSFPTSTKVDVNVCAGLLTNFKGEVRVELVPRVAIRAHFEECISADKFNESDWNPKVRHPVPDWNIYGYSPTHIAEELPTEIKVRLFSKIPFKNLASIHMNILSETLEFLVKTATFVKAIPLK
ncbi:MAG: hypothetical protein Greene041662_913 [Candidatus Peregrinibacteria bacterium Greene0416_62]|nr:MAG: hypothetical protein Greene041662_913 [Candidatus Peregrinibacteria bacterium Greene0416_62]